MLCVGTVIRPVAKHIGLHSPWVQRVARDSGALHGEPSSIARSEARLLSGPARIAWKDVRTTSADFGLVVEPKRKMHMIRTSIKCLNR